MPELLKGVHVLTDARARVAAGLKEVRARVLAPAPRPKDVGELLVREMRDREVRDLMRARARGEVKILYFEALQTGNRDLLRAIESSPEPLVDAHTRAQADEIRLQADEDYRKLVVIQHGLEWASAKVAEITAPVITTPAAEPGVA